MKKYKKRNGLVPSKNQTNGFRDRKGKEKKTPTPSVLPLQHSDPLSLLPLSAPPIAHAAGGQPRKNSASAA
jgi:hypothetical protein